jgi:hypothetical protein
MEAELTSLDRVIVEAKWLRQLFLGLPVLENPIPIVQMNFDN